MNCLPLILAFSISASPFGDSDRSRREGDVSATVMNRSEKAFDRLNTATHKRNVKPSDPESILHSRREELSAARLRHDAITAEKHALDSKLDVLNRRIESLKREHAGRGSGPRWSSPTLEASLQDSQELSKLLSQKAEEERQAEQLVLQRRDRLTSALDQEIERLHATWDKIDLDKLNKILVPRLRALYSERRALLQTPAPASTSSKEALLNLSPRDTDDAMLLSEMADAFLDSEDKLRREEKALAQHIEQLVNEQELERRLAALMEEDALFDETERRISLVRSAHLSSESKPAVSSSSDSSSSLASLASSGTDTNGTSETQGASDTGQMTSATGTLSSDTLSKTITPSSSISPVSEASSGSGVSAPASTDNGSGTVFVNTEPSTTESTSAAVSGNSLAAAGRSNVEKLSSDAIAHPFQGDWSESNSIKALRAHQAYLKAKADEFHRKAEEASRRARNLL